MDGECRAARRRSNRACGVATWTDERIEGLAWMWADGASATDIAKALGCFAHCDDGGRNAVLGKLKRLGLMRSEKPRVNYRIRNSAAISSSSLPTPSTTGAAPAADMLSAVPSFRDGNHERLLTQTLRKIGKGGGGIAQAVARRKHQRSAPVCDVPDRDEPAEHRCSLMELNSRRCKWPIGDPRQAGFGFCGHAIAQGPYCAGHAARAYKPRRARA